jgi:proteasome lid subunit RPN8/RPN11
LYVTRGLVTVLLELARDAEPGEVTANLAVTPAEELRGAESLPPDVPVFTDFYLPDSGGSVNAVFGVDLSTPSRQTQGRFVSHPQGDLAVSRTDDLHEAVFVAVPPWEEENLAVFDRRGRRRDLTVVDAEPPRESIS